MRSWRILWTVDEWGGWQSWAEYLWYWMLSEVLAVAGVGVGDVVGDVVAVAVGKGVVGSTAMGWDVLVVVALAFDVDVAVDTVRVAFVGLYSQGVLPIVVVVVVVVVMIYLPLSISATDSLCLFVENVQGIRRVSVISDNDNDEESFEY